MPPRLVEFFEFVACAWPGPPPPPCRALRARSATSRSFLAAIRIGGLCIVAMSSIPSIASVANLEAAVFATEVDGADNNKVQNNAHYVGFTTDGLQKPLG